MQLSVKVLFTLYCYRNTKNRSWMIPNVLFNPHPLQKHQDAFASAFGFFLLGFDVISRYSSPQGIHIQFFGITDPVLWFFKVAIVTADILFSSVNNVLCVSLHQQPLPL